MVGLVVLLLLSVPPANERRAAQLFHASQVDYNLGQFAAALQEIEEAYRLDPKPELLFNLGQCHRSLSHWAKAAYFYRVYLREKPDAPNRDSVEQLIAEVDAREESRLAAARAAKPAPAAVLVLPPPPPPAAEPAPPASVAQPFPAPPKHGHGAGIGVLAASIALTAVAVVGVAMVETFNANYPDRAPSAPGQPAVTWNGATQSALAQANTWEGVWIASAVLAGAGYVTTPFVW